MLGMKSHNELHLHKQLQNIKKLIEFDLLLVTGLICWECTWDSRDSKTNGFCKEPFDTTNITKAQRYWNYKNCTETSNHSVHCRKVIKSGRNLEPTRKIWNQTTGFSIRQFLLFQKKMQQ